MGNCCHLGGCITGRVSLRIIRRRCTGTVRRLSKGTLMLSLVWVLRTKGAMVSVQTMYKPINGTR